MRSTSPSSATSCRWVALSEHVVVCYAMLRFWHMAEAPDFLLDP